MKAEFWDVKAGKKVTTEVVDAVKYANGGFAFKGKTADGRNLTRFVKAADYEKWVKDNKKCCCKKK